MFCLRPAKAMLPSSQGYVSVQSRQSVGIHVTTVCLIPSLDGAAVHGDVGLVQGHAEVILPSGYPFVLRVRIAGIDIGGSEVKRRAERLHTRKGCRDGQRATELLREEDERVGNGFCCIIF